MRGASADSALRIAGRAFLVAVAYYVGANIGLILRFPPTTPSLLWPPNSILTATLILTPRRQWWIYLLAVLPVHVAAELQTAWPLSLVLALFATNCSEALIAATCVRRFSDDPTGFGTLRGAAVFVLSAGLLAPFLSSFPDAAAVAAALGEPYWHVWQTRFSSNVLTALALVPAIVTVSNAGPGAFRRMSMRRRIEATLLVVGLLTVGSFVFGGPREDAWTLSRAPVTALAFILPFALWATVRFGAGGTSLSLLATALLASWAATHGRGPFIGLLPGEGVLALQVSLAVIAVPLMFVAALVDERRQAENALAERLRFEELLSRLSGDFVRLASHQMDQAFESWLRQLGEFLDLDGVALSRLSGDGEELVVAYSWAAPGVERVPRVTMTRDIPWTVERLLRSQLVVFSHWDELPSEAARDVESLRRHGILSNFIIPLMAGGRILGGLSFVTVSEERTWGDELVQRLQLLAEVLANALARKETEDALRASELMKSAILTSLTSSVAVLDREGWIIAVNDSWARFGDESQVAIGVGMNYLDSCRNAARKGMPGAEDASNGIEAVLGRTRTGFAQEYVRRASSSERWFSLSVVSLNRPEGGAVISLNEVTERKRAEADAQRSRQELAHSNRVSTMGELTASLAHELNQPLTAILTNAQVARRFLDMAPPALGDLREILSDIVEDDKRAAEIIRRLRDLLRKGESESERALLDLNALIRDVTKLVSSDAIIRSVTMNLECGPDPAVVRGDRVQLQQVVLNLLLNALEATAESGNGNRIVSVRTTKTAQAVRVSVEDTGPGLRADAERTIFEPFYTTKPSGMGMGLSIARSIITLHDGNIWAANNASMGAAFQFELPLADDRAA